MGVLGALETILGLDDNQMKSAAVDIFSYIVEFSPSMVREFIVQEGLKQDDVSYYFLACWKKQCFHVQDSEENF